MIVRDEEEVVALVALSSSSVNDVFVAMARGRRETTNNNAMGTSKILNLD